MQLSETLDFAFSGCFSKTIAVCGNSLFIMHQAYLEFRNASIERAKKITLQVQLFEGVASSADQPRLFKVVAVLTNQPLVCKGAVT